MLKDDDKTLKELGMKDGIKMMLIGSTINEVMQATVPVVSEGQQKFEGTSFVFPPHTFLIFAFHLHTGKLHFEHF